MCDLSIVSLLVLLLFTVIPMTHAPETGTINDSIFPRRFLEHVSHISGTGFVWYQIPVPIRTLFYSKPESGVHVTEMIIYDWSMITALFTGSNFIKNYEFIA